MIRFRSAALGLFILTAATTPVVAQPGRGPKTREQVIEQAVAYLKSSQAEDGTWSKAASPGVTGVVLLGMMKSGRVEASDPAVAKATKFIESLEDPAGHLAAGEKIFHKNYLTSINLLALKATGTAKYTPVVAKAANYLRDGQRGAKDMLPETDQNFGGFGYNPETRADLSNTHFVLDSLAAADTPKDHPVYRRAAVFISRMQNLQSEHNSLPWAGKVNDGSFFYVMPQPGGGKGGGNPDDPRPGYGSMTAAGVRGLLQCGISRTDPRVVKGREWLAKNYSVDLNPGRPEGAAGQGYHYYLMTLSKCLDTLGEDTFTDAAGKAHDWRAEVTRALTNRQKKDGSWGNESSTWMESDPNLCTGYALITLSYCQPKSR